jgi:hypothetical protein
MKIKDLKVRDVITYKGNAPNCFNGKATVEYKRDDKYIEVRRHDGVAGGGDFGQNGDGTPNGFWIISGEERYIKLVSSHRFEGKRIKHNAY